MTDQQASDIAAALTVALAAELIVVLICGLYILRVYFGSARLSRTFRSIVRDDVFKVVAGGWIGLMIVLYYSRDKPFPLWTRPFNVLAVMVLFFPVIDHALTIRSLRKTRRLRGGADGPPPFDGED
jgi:hypothetical protein